MAGKNKRDKRDEVYKERVRQLRTGEISAPPPLVQPEKAPVPTRTKKTATTKQAGVLAFAMDDAEIAYRQGVMNDMVTSYGANLLRMQNFLDGYEKRVEKIKKDDLKFLKKSQALFAQPEFRKHRLNRKVIEHISNKIGGFNFALMNTNPEAFMKQIIQGARFIPEGEIDWLTLALMSSSEKLMEQKRIDDAILAITWLQIMMDLPKEPNPFTLAMLIQGVDDYNANQSHEFDAVLEKLGLTKEQLKAQGAPDFNSPKFVPWLMKKMRDEKLMERLEEAVAQNPALEEYAQKNLSQAESSVTLLLEQPEAESLLYTREELDEIGIFDYFNEKYQAMLETYPGGIEAYEQDLNNDRNKKKKERSNQIIQKILGETVVELVRRLVTDKYLELLRTRSEDYKNKKQKSANKGNANFVLVHVNSLLDIKDEATRQERALELSIMFQIAGKSLQFAGLAAASQSQLEEVEEEEE